VYGCVGPQGSHDDDDVLDDDDVVSDITFAPSDTAQIILGKIFLHLDKQHYLSQFVLSNIPNSSTTL